MSMQVSMTGGTTIMQSGDRITINGHELKCPVPILGQSLTQVNGKVYVNGKKYDKKSKTFKMSIMGLIYYLT